MLRCMTRHRTPDDYRGLSLWHDTIDDDLRHVRRSGATRRRRRRRRRGLHGALDGIPPRHADPTIRRGRHREGDRRLRRVRGATAAGARRSSPRRSRGWPPRAAATRRCGCSTCCTTRWPTIGRIAAAEGIDCHFDQGGYLAVARNPAQLAAAPCGGLPTIVGWGFGEDDHRLLDAHEVSGDRRRPRCPRRLVHAPLCGDPPCSAGPRPGRRRRAAGRRHPRAHRRGRRGQPTSRHGTRHRPSRARRPRDRGLHADRRGPAPGHRADLLAHDGDGAAAGRHLGSDRAGEAHDVRRQPAPDDLRPTHP